MTFHPTPWTRASTWHVTLIALTALILPLLAHGVAHAANPLFTDSRFSSNFPGAISVVAINSSQMPTTTTTLFPTGGQSVSIRSTLLSSYLGPTSQAGLKAFIQSQLAAALKSAGGYGLYGAPTIVLDQQPQVEGFTDPSRQQIGLSMTLRNNSVSAEVTTPGILGSYANPKFTFTFSAQIVVLFALQNNQISVTQGLVRTFNGNIGANNLAGDIVKALANFGVIESPSLNQSSDIPSSIQNQLNLPLALVDAQLQATGGSAALVAPTTEVAIATTTNRCVVAGQQSVASPCTCLPGLNQPGECDTYGTAMCLSAAQLASVPSCPGTQYLSCSNLPAIGSRDNAGHWLSGVKMTCTKVAPAGGGAGSSHQPIQSPKEAPMGGH